MDWDLVLDDDECGPLNMARDEHLLRRAIVTGRPSLRLYGWERLTLSLGRAQKLDGRIDRAACHAMGLPMLRRSTGGQAVLHGQDLTYAVAAPLAASAGATPAPPV
ncbi:MAG: lipoate--protein ligase family protein, partial [Candidatus Lambdaproteobacteria bacterium]|nr:lipoate--protein ligase family protein [Candidatus Lambdaproteobacteria bacterium]